MDLCLFLFRTETLAAMLKDCNDVNADPAQNEGTQYIARVTAGAILIEVGDRKKDRTRCKRPINIVIAKGNDGYRCRRND